MARWTPTFSYTEKKIKKIDWWKISFWSVTQCLSFSSRHIQTLRDNIRSGSTFVMISSLAHLCLSWWTSWAPPPVWRASPCRPCTAPPARSASWSDCLGPGRPAGGDQQAIHDRAQLHGNGPERCRRSYHGMRWGARVKYIIHQSSQRSLECKGQGQTFPFFLAPSPLHKMWNDCFFCLFFFNQPSVMSHMELISLLFHCLNVSLEGVAGLLTIGNDAWLLPWIPGWKWSSLKQSKCILLTISIIGPWSHMYQNTSTLCV